MLELIAELPAEGSRLAVAPDGEGWAVVAPDGASLWRGRTAAGVLAPPPSRLHEASFSLDGAMLLAAPERASLAEVAWQALGDLRPLLRSRTRAGRRIVTACWAPDGMELLVAIEDPAGSSASPRQQVVTLDPVRRTERTVLWEDDEWMRVEALAHAGARLAAAALEVRLFDTGCGETRATVRGRGVQVRRLAFSPADELLAVGYADGEVTIADATTGAVRASWRAHADEAVALAWGDGGESLATGGGDGRVALWHQSGELSAEHARGGPVVDVAFLGPHRLLALRDAPAGGAAMLGLTAAARP